MNTYFPHLKAFGQASRRNWPAAMVVDLELRRPQQTGSEKAFQTDSARCSSRDHAAPSYDIDKKC